MAGWNPETGRPTAAKLAELGVGAVAIKGEARRGDPDMGTSKFDNVPQRRYQDAAGQVKTGDLLFCSGEYAFSKLIRHASQSKFSHVGFLFRWHDRVLLLESVEDDGVRAVELAHYLNNYENSGGKYHGAIYIGRCTRTPGDEATLNRLLGRAADLLNRNYDKEELAKIAWRIATKLGRHEDDKEYICSEFVDECFTHVGVRFPRDAGGYIFPEHIAADPTVIPQFEIVP